MALYKRFKDLTRLRRGLLIVLAAVAALALALTLYIFSGSAAVESWVGSQLLSLGGSYLEPQLRFGRLTYRRPRTILVDNLTISSPDPAHPDQSLIILAVKRLRLELTEIPRRGQPIKFSEVILEDPEFRAIALAPGSHGLVGFSHILKASATSAPSAAPGTRPALPLTLSDLLRIRRIEIIHGLIRYDPRLPNTQPMQLDDINARLDLAPSHTTPGLYAIETTITRQPTFELAVRGQFNLDTLTAQLDGLALALDLRKENAHYLPPEIQQVLAAAEITGQLHVAAAGTIPLANFPQSTLHATAEITGAGFAAGPYRFWADSFNSALDVAHGIATIQKADARLLGGEVHLTGTIPLQAAQPAQLELSAQNIQIEKTLREVDPTTLPRYAGSVAARVTFAAPLAVWSSQASGTGTFSLRQGRIHNTPVFGLIVAGITNAHAKTTTTAPATLTDIADATFTLSGDHAQFEHLTATSGGLAIRGSGTVGFDQQLDFRLNAGPLEALQGAMGDLGKAWAGASDSLAGYRVTGTLSEPHVSFEVGEHAAKK